MLPFDREIMQQALEALELAYSGADAITVHGKAITALCERLAQPVQEPYCYVYASRLAKHLWEKHYMKDAPQWKPFDDLIGVLTQIDNMTTGLTRLAQPEQEIEYCNPGTELYKVVTMVMSDCGHSSNNQRLLDRVAQRIEKHLDAHAVLVAAAEREACAKVCEDAAIKLFSGKARVNQVDRHTAEVLQEKAAAIRERKDT